MKTYKPGIYQMSSSEGWQDWRIFSSLGHVHFPYPAQLKVEPLCPSLHWLKEVLAQISVVWLEELNKGEDTI